MFSRVKLPSGVLEGADDEVERRQDQEQQREERRTARRRARPMRRAGAPAGAGRRPRPARRLAQRSPASSAAGRSRRPVATRSTRLLDVGADDAVPLLGDRCPWRRPARRASGTRPWRRLRPAAACRAGPAGILPFLAQVVEADRVAVALEPAELAFVGVEVLHPELGGVRVRRVGADRLDVDAGDDAGLRHDDLDLRVALRACRGRRARCSPSAMTIGVVPCASDAALPITGTKLPVLLSSAKNFEAGLAPPSRRRRRPAARPAA